MSLAIILCFLILLNNGKSHQLWNFCWGRQRVAGWHPQDFQLVWWWQNRDCPDCVWVGVGSVDFVWLVLFWTAVTWWMLEGVSASRISRESPRNWVKPWLKRQGIEGIWIFGRRHGSKTLSALCFNFRSSVKWSKGQIAMEMARSLPRTDDFNSDDRDVAGHVTCGHCCLNCLFRPHIGFGMSRISTTSWPKRHSHRAFLRAWNVPGADSLGTEKVPRDSVEPGLFREVEVWRDGVFFSVEICLVSIHRRKHDFFGSRSQNMSFLLLRPTAMISHVV